MGFGSGPRDTTRILAIISSAWAASLKDTRCSSLAGRISGIKISTFLCLRGLSKMATATFGSTRLDVERGRLSADVGGFRGLGPLGQKLGLLQDFSLSEMRTPSESRAFWTGGNLGALASSCDCRPQ